MKLTHIGVGFVTGQEGVLTEQIVMNGPFKPDRRDTHSGYMYEWGKDGKRIFPLEAVDSGQKGPKPHWRIRSHGNRNYTLTVPVQNLNDSGLILGLFGYKKSENNTYVGLIGPWIQLVQGDPGEFHLGFNVGMKYDGIKKLKMSLSQGNPLTTEVCETIASETTKKKSKPQSHCFKLNVRDIGLELAYGPRGDEGHFPNPTVTVKEYSEDYSFYGSKGKKDRV